MSEHIPSFQTEDHLRRVLAALLTRLGHQNVQITHGPLERGKDLIFSIPDAFGFTQHCACVVKNTPMTADHTKAERLDAVLGQVCQAFESPFLDANAKEAFITKCFIVCPHEIPQMTLELIKHKLQQFGERLTIIDGPRLFSLLQAHYPEYKIDEFAATQRHLAQFREPLRKDAAITNLALAGISAAASRDGYQIYVQPSFEAVIRHWALDDNWLQGLVPEMMKPFERRLKGAYKTIETINPLAYYVSSSHLSLLQVASDSYAEKIRPFRDLDLVSPETHQRIMEAYRSAAEVVSTHLVLDSRSVSRNLQNTFGEHFVVPSGRFSDLTDDDLPLLHQAKVALTDRLGEAIKQVNEYLGSSFGDLLKHHDLTGLLEAPEFQRALYLSDIFNINPHPNVYEKNLKRFVLDKRAFHGRPISAFIVGPAGFGKTSFCRWHTIEDDRLFSEQQHGWISVYIALHKLTKQELLTLEETIAGYARTTVTYFSRTRSSKEGFRIYLDGLDEVIDEDDRSRVLDLLRRKPAIDGPAAYVVTSRDYLIGSGTLGIPRLALAVLSDDKVIELSRLWLQDSKLVKELKAQLGTAPALKELARIPLLGTLIILVFRRTKGLPENKLRLYECFIGLLCSGWDLAKGVQRGARHKAEFKILVLRRTAFHVHTNRSKSFSPATINNVLRELDVRFDSGEAALLIDELLTDGVIQRSGSDLEFRHLSFQEYLAAVDLFHDPLRDNAGSCLESYLEGDNWYRDVLQFYVQLVRDPVSAVRWIDREVQTRKISKGSRTKATIESLKNVARQGLMGL